MLDYKETFAYAEFWRENIAPKLRHMMTGSTSFAEYLSGFYGRSTNASSFGAPLPYVYTLEWLSRFQEKCVTFSYNQPDEIAKGAAIIAVIYQMSPHLHAYSNLNLWREDGESDGQITTFVVYEKWEDVLDFCKANLDIVKQPKTVQKGFGFVQP